MDIVGTGLLNELPEHIRHFLQLVFLISFNFTKKKKKKVFPFKLKHWKKEVMDIIKVPLRRAISKWLPSFEYLVL